MSDSDTTINLTEADIQYLADAGSHPVGGVLVAGRSVTNYLIERHREENQVRLDCGVSPLSHHAFLHGFINVIGPAAHAELKQIGRPWRTYQWVMTSHEQQLAADALALDRLLEFLQTRELRASLQRRQERHPDGEVIELRSGPIGPRLPGVLAFPTEEEAKAAKASQTPSDTPLKKISREMAMQLCEIKVAELMAEKNYRCEAMAKALMDDAVVGPQLKTRYTDFRSLRKNLLGPLWEAWEPKYQRHAEGHVASLAAPKLH